MYLNSSLVKNTLLKEAVLKNYKHIFERITENIFTCTIDIPIFLKKKQIAIIILVRFGLIVIVYESVYFIIIFIFIYYIVKYTDNKIYT